MFCLVCCRVLFVLNNCQVKDDNSWFSCALLLQLCCCFLSVKSKQKSEFQKILDVVDPKVLCRNKYLKMELLDEDNEPTLADFIDRRLAGMTKKKPLRLNGTTFIAAYLQLIIKSQDFKQVHQSFQERLRHLSFLVHLLCRYDDFDSIFQEYKIVQVKYGVTVLLTLTFLLLILG